MHQWVCWRAPRVVPLTGCVVALCTVALCTVALGGCQARSAARLSEVEKTVQDGNTTVESLIEITYNDDDSVKDMTFSNEGRFDSRADFFYESGVLDRMLITIDNDAPDDFRFSWDGPRLTKTERVDGSYLANFAYAGDTLEEIERIDVSLFTGGSVESVTTLFRNDANEIVETQTVIGSTDALAVDSTTTDVYEREDGVLEQVTRSIAFRSGTVTGDFVFDYNDAAPFGAKSLRSVSAENAYAIEYDDEGRIDSIEEVSGLSSTTTRYTYEDGASNIVWAPAVPFENSFDMRGNPFADIDLMNITVLVGNYQ